MDNIPGLPTQTAFYNESIQQILRLHDIWVACHRLSTSGDLKGWKWKLDAAWRELSAAAKRMDENIEKPVEKWEYKKKQWDKIVIEANTPERLYQALNDKEEFIRHLQDKCGKGAKWKDMDDDDFD